MYLSRDDLSHLRKHSIFCCYCVIIYANKKTRFGRVFLLVCNRSNCTMMLRRGQDLNLRWGFHTRFPGARIRPDYATSPKVRLIILAPRGRIAQLRRQRRHHE